jgi:hypothetical protein
MVRTWTPDDLPAIAVAFNLAVEFYGGILERNARMEIGLIK